MARYIDEELVKEDILQRFDALKGSDFGTSTFRDGLADGYARIMSDLRNIPAADVRENVHAHWVYKPLEGFSEVTFPVCSNCDEDAIDYVESNFCPKCGAVMDEPTMEEYMYGQEGSEEDGSL